MKTVTLALVAASLLQLSVAQPHGHRHEHVRKHQKKDVVSTIVHTAYRPQVIVWVDGNGNPVSTATTTVAVPTTLVTTYPGVATSAPAIPTSAPVLAPAPASGPAPALGAHAAAPAPASSGGGGTGSGSGSAGGGGYGFSYSPYTASGACKSQDQVNADLAAVGSGYSVVRIYGTDCNQVQTVLSAAKSRGLKLFAGVFDIANLNNEIGLIVSAANGDWSQFDTISIGNELVNSGRADAATVVAAIGTARGLLKAAGYAGKVVTVDTLVATRQNPSLCGASDVCTVNCHPFFDGNVDAENVGNFLTTQIASLRSVLSDSSQPIVITETGWPSAGQANGAAMPSPTNQKTAISAIKAAFSSNPAGVILFSTFNDQWKQDSSSTFGAEKFWGFLGNAPSN
ncbi:glycoside hydrolase superfamily [Xylogone sp. PMI_703]|nr:glycoside hydrolase superfamily [Xylogone sp. PMI_703]